MLLPVSSVQVNAASPVYLTNRGTTAVDVKGIRHNGNDYPQLHPPWLDNRSKVLDQAILVKREPEITKAVVYSG